MAQPRVQRVVYPVLVGLVLIALWQGLVTAMELPPYLVPSPILMMKTLFTDWAALAARCGSPSRSRCWPLWWPRWRAC